MRYLFRWAFDVLVFVIVNIIFMNVLFGMIIDTFKVLRNEANQIQQEKSNLCYICYLNRSEVG